MAKIFSWRHRNLYTNEDFGVQLKQAAYALDSTTIDLCLSLFPWAKFRKHKAAVKLRTLMDLKGSIPTFIRITDGKVRDVNILDELILEPGAIYIMDRGYLDFARLYSFTQNLSTFITRAKTNLDYRRVYYRKVNKTTGLRCDQTIKLNGYYASKDYPAVLRRISYFDVETDKRLVFLTNNFTLPPLTIVRLYKCRWRIEIFFKWVKQYLRIKTFFGITENAVKTQIWIAISVYVLVAIIKKEIDSIGICYFGQYSESRQLKVPGEAGISSNRVEFGRNLANSQHCTFRESSYYTSTYEKSVAKRFFSVS